MSSTWSRARELILPVGLVASIMVILVPLPGMLMDLLLATNITVAIIVLLTTVLVRTPAEFSVFPSLLLTTTLARLVLNVATTRLILTKAETDGLTAAGGVVKSFGEYVAGNNEIVGLVIFTIILAIQFLVITKGATRISEVAARFALDGLPGRQMAIDADLSGGAISESEAHRRRDRLAQQADFYAAMDGASKFVRGDAVAGLVITLVNIVGGLAIGVFQLNMSVGQAGALFTRLTIGDGLVSQLPALLIALAAGLLVTRSTHKSNLPSDFLRQAFANPTALAVASGFLVLLVFTQFPKMPLLVLGSGCCGLSIVLSRNAREKERRKSKIVSQAQQPRRYPNEETVENLLAVDPMELEIGLALIPLADPNRGGDLLARINAVRKQIIHEVGIVLPKVRIRDNIRLPDTAYRFHIANTPVARGDIHPNRLLARRATSSDQVVDGIATTDPVSGQPAVWIEVAERDRAELLGYRIIDPTEVLAMQLREIALKHADELLTRDATKHLLDQLRRTAPVAVDEVVPHVMKVGQVQRVLQCLLREAVPIRQLSTIMEILGDLAPEIKDPVVLAERVRGRLARILSQQYRSADGRLAVVRVDPKLEARIADSVRIQDGSMSVRIEPSDVDSICEAVDRQTLKLRIDERPSVLLVSPHIRAGLSGLISTRLPNVRVLSFDEVTHDTQVETVGIVMDSGNS